VKLSVGNENDNKILESLPLTHLMASITPVLGVGDQSFRQSMAYINSLIEPGEKNAWAKQSKIGPVLANVMHGMG
jgi:hypothetical protein